MPSLGNPTYICSLQLGKSSGCNVYDDLQFLISHVMCMCMIIIPLKQSVFSSITMLIFSCTQQKGLKLLSNQADLNQAQAIHDSQPHATSMKIVLSPEVPSPSQRSSPPYFSPTSSPHEPSSRSQSPPSPTRLPVSMCLQVFHVVGCQLQIQYSVV